MNVELVPIAALRPHEEVNADHVQRIAKEIVRDGGVKRPLIVSRDCLTLLDGHHRYQVLRLLEADHAPCILVDYNDTAKVEVTPWRSDEAMSPQIVRLAASSGVMLPAKTSRHKLHFKVPPMHWPLADLFAGGVAHPSVSETRLEKETSCSMVHA